MTTIIVLRDKVQDNIDNLSMSIYFKNIFTHWVTYEWTHLLCPLKATAYASSESFQLHVQS